MTAYDEIGNVPSGREVTLTSVVSLTIGTGNNIGKMESKLGPTLDLLPKYAFAVPPLGSYDDIPHYQGITRSQRTNSNDNAYYTIDQFKTFRINEVSDSSGNIPVTAFKTRINVPPPGEIKIFTSGVGSVNSFSNNFMTFDNVNNTFDEAVDSSNTRATSVGIYTSFDQNAIKFDITSETFDTGS